MTRQYKQRLLYRAMRPLFSTWLSRTRAWSWLWQRIPHRWLFAPVDDE